MIEPISLSESWEIDATVSGSDLTVGISNWAEPLEPAPHELFRVNCAVSDDAELNDITTVYTNVILVLDAWGNSGVPFVNGDGTVTINEVLSSKEPDNYPTVFSLDQVYPNPFNPVTSIVFSVPEHNNENVVIPTSCNFRLMTLPENIGELSALRKLALNNNELTSIPESITSLTSLEQLLLESNKITSLPDDIGNLVNLEVLIINFNQV